MSIYPTSSDAGKWLPGLSTLGTHWMLLYWVKLIAWNNGSGLISYPENLEIINSDPWSVFKNDSKFDKL